MSNEELTDNHNFRINNLIQTVETYADNEKVRQQSNDDSFDEDVFDQAVTLILKQLKEV